MRPETMRREVQRAAARFDDGLEGEALMVGVLNFVGGYLLGAEMYQGAAALTRLMARAGVEPAPLLQELLAPPTAAGVGERFHYGD
jgi:hypothetical protein